MDISWETRLSSFFMSETFINLQRKIEEQRKNKIIFPPHNDVFKALSLPFDDVKVIILGQDPYHGECQAHGLSFSVPPFVNIPPSLQNIFKEAKVTKTSGDLTGWMKQGVLLLNSILTVEKSKPKSHASLGWQTLTRIILDNLVKEKTHLVFLLWGRDAQNNLQNIDLKESHLVLKSSHPSPLGCHHNAPVPFKGCDHFFKTNIYLRENGLGEIDWSA